MKKKISHTQKVCLTRWRSFPAIGDCACRTSLVSVSHLGEPGVGVADRVATGKRNWSTGGCEYVGNTLTLWRIWST